MAVSSPSRTAPGDQGRPVGRTRLAGSSDGVAGPYPMVRMPGSLWTMPGLWTAARPGGALELLPSPPNLPVVVKVLKWAPGPCAQPHIRRTKSLGDMLLEHHRSTVFWRGGLRGTCAALSKHHGAKNISLSASSPEAGRANRRFEPCWTVVSLSPARPVNLNRPDGGAGGDDPGRWAGTTAWKVLIIAALPLILWFA